jgi:hypothetical protein
VSAAGSKATRARLIEVAAVQPAARLGEVFGGGLALTRRQAPPLDLGSQPLAVIAERDVASAAAASDWAALATMTWYDRPFHFAVSSNLLAAGDDLLHWVSSNDRWRRHDGGFYTADVISVDALAPDGEVGVLFDVTRRRTLERAVSTAFGAALRLHGPIAVHRMAPGQGIGIHCDAPSAGEETHRVVVLLAGDRAMTDGGHFLFLENERPSSLQAIFPLVHNSAIAFELTGRSFHAVTTVMAGHRYSLVMSFRGDRTQAERSRDRSGA